MLFDTSLDDTLNVALDETVHCFFSNCSMGLI